jgi:ABC-type multidrug transport system fused ATPase/permease subunit
MFNFKRRRNLTMFICFIIIVMWNIRIEFDLVKTDFKLFAILDFFVILLFFLALRTSIKSRKIAMEAYQAHVRANRGIERK